MEDLVIEKMLRNDATPQIKGIMYQFLVALEYCFSLKEGQSLFVEHFGDVAILSNGSTNFGDAVEVKLYDEGNLTLKHHNFLNTIYNWMQDDYDINEYQNLVLFTTQPLNEEFKEWYGLVVDERQSSLLVNYSKYIEKHKDDKEPGATVKQNIKQMQYVLDRKDKLHNVLEKLELLDSQPKFDEKYEYLCKTYLAMIVNSRSKRMCISAFLGVIITSILDKKIWHICYEDFQQLKEILCAKFATQKFLFPQVSDIDVDGENFSEEEFPFVRKLLDIQVDDEDFERCIYDYACVTELLKDDAEEPILAHDIRNFRKRLNDEYLVVRSSRKALLRRDADEDSIVSQSKAFMWDLFRMSKTDVPFAPYSDVDQYVYNGMYHHMANELDSIKWRLK